MNKDQAPYGFFIAEINTFIAVSSKEEFDTLMQMMRQGKKQPEVACVQEKETDMFTDFDHIIEEVRLSKYPPSSEELLEIDF